MAKNATVSIPEFHQMLVLAKWALGIFDGASFGPIQAALRNPALEGLNDETGHTRFYHALVGSSLFYLGDDAKCGEAEIAAYDLRIVGYWKRITAKRNIAENTVYKLKYYQYLTLLVTELYLDWYFNRPAELLAEVNAAISKYNESAAKEKLPAAKTDDLNKISFWEATGAGKTLMMDVNVLQYRFYAKEKPDHTILLTPDEGLARQHLGELKLSDIQCSLISDDNPLFTQDGYTVGVIDAGKIISDESSRKKGEKSFRAEEFEGRNLLLVDEGHNGSSSAEGERRRVRAQLCKDGFTFEYSATFGQAVAKASGSDGAALRQEYARNILFDYSYKFFYEDGYGKNAFILNMSDAKDEERVFEYLCANLLKFVQQQAIFVHEEGVMTEFNIERPLCLFVGNTVTGKKGNEEESLSDVETVVAFFAKVLSDPSKVEKLFDKFVKNKPVLVNDQGFNMLEQAFLPMLGWYADGKGCYGAMLDLVMHAASAQRLKVTHLKSPDEVVLSVGLAAPFAVVHIGDSAGFMRKVGDLANLDVMPADEFSASVFEGVNKKDSPINFLIGSRKFTQGWSCWRVSAMGLLNMGVSEGTQIIQLFGRGVRLKGKGYSLKRSVPKDRPKGSFVEKMETLNVFGVRAEYMVTFRGYLNEEGVITEDSVITLKFDIKTKKGLPALETMDVADGYRINQSKGYKTQKAVLFAIPEGMKKKIKPPHVIYDDFSYLQSMQKGTSEKLGITDEKGEVRIPPAVFKFFDWDGIYRRLLDAKANRGYWNLEVRKDNLIAFATGDTSWYTLYSRPDDVRFDGFDKVGKLQAIVEILLAGYMDSFYKTLQKLFEDEHLVRKTLSLDEIPDEYVFQIENTAAGLVWEKRLKELQALIAKGDVNPTDVNKWSSDDLVAIAFARHLYEPLFYTKKGKQLPFVLRPVTFDAPSELCFLRDLIAFYSDEQNAALFKDVDLYLMRNPSNKSKGIGFAQAGNFYPDFLLWLVDKKTGQQHLSFVDPKGLRNVPFDSPKLDFALECKNLEAQINKGREDKLILNSFILSDTPKAELLTLFSEHTQEDYEAKNVFFLEDGGSVYLPKLFAALK